MNQSRFEVYDKYSRGDWHRSLFASEGPDGDYRHRISTPCSAIAESIQAGQRHLDVGAGTGVAVEVLRSLGVDAHGCEPSPDAAKFWKHLPIVQGSVYDIGESIMRGERFWSCSLFDVIEHLQWPEKALTILSRITGRIWITTPHAAEPVGKKGSTLSSSYHVREWTRQSLDDFVEGCIGWRPFWSQTYKGMIYVAYEAA